MSSFGTDKFLSKLGLSDSSPNGNLPSDLDRLCVGTGGGFGLLSCVASLFLVVCFTDSNGLLNDGFGAGGGGGCDGGLLRLTDEQRTGNGGGGDSSGPDTLSSFLDKK